jgi:hypothetical protein
MRFKKEELNNKDWLLSFYIEKQISSVEIASMLNISYITVCRALKFHNISIRNSSQSLIIKKERDFILNESTLIGTLLGDADLNKRYKFSKNCLPCYRKNNKFFDHLLFSTKNLITENESKIKKRFRKNAHSEEIYAISSLKDEKLIKYFEEWYPAPLFKKIVPDSLILDKEILLQWFLDDGYSFFRKGKKKNTVYVGFSTQGFSKLDNEKLCQKINQKFDLNCKVARSGSEKKRYYILLIQPKFTKKFFDIIGPPPIESLSYKWKTETANV